MSYVLGQLLTVQPALFKRWVTLASSIHRTTVTFITNILFHASWPPEGNLKYEWFIPAHSWGWTKSGINLKGQQNLSLMAKLHWPKKPLVNVEVLDHVAAAQLSERGSHQPIMQKDLWWWSKHRHLGEKHLLFVCMRNTSDTQRERCCLETRALFACPLWYT